ncbi:MAG: ribbon-helix-helix domain-containing protein [Nanoarchaeota archaeon]|nr:ribbon-helix-helix domain-containing protein [Nanoarchaeota archaeon]MBU0962845.1 ribbon-helix-helix domain-containing protein [Nanoarchaeota archaeon]
MKRYVNIALPEDLARQIDRIIKEAEMGYKTKGEFVKDAVRSLLKDMARHEDLKKRNSKQYKNKQL